MTETVCVDASMMVALLIPERFSPAALALWEQWALDDVDIRAPLLLRYEVTSALYRKAFSGQMERADIRLALGHFLALDLAWQDAPALALRAVELAEAFQRPNTYDAHYLALAERLDCPLWTADERLFNAVQGGFPYIRWLGAA